jgi:hypothetical protein
MRTISRRRSSLLSTSDKIALASSIALPFQMLLVLGGAGFIAYMVAQIMDDDDDDKMRPA